MAQVNNISVLAIAVDAAEPTFIRHLIDHGELPKLKSLLFGGKWLRVKSPAHLGSGSVWPTFIAGQSPSVHGVYGEWLWDPTFMSVTRYNGKRVTPFWKNFVERGVSVGVLDIPFMPQIGISKGFEISEWGPHDIVDAATRFAPVSIANTVAQHSPHPLQTRLEISGLGDDRGLEQVGNICLNGIAARGKLTRALLAETQPQLALIGFSELHHAAHYLWHQVEPDHSDVSRCRSWKFYGYPANYGRHLSRTGSTGRRTGRDGWTRNVDNGFFTAWDATGVGHTVISDVMALRTGILPS